MKLTIQQLVTALENFEFAKPDVRVLVTAYNCFRDTVTAEFVINGVGKQIAFELECFGDDQVLVVHEMRRGHSEWLLNSKDHDVPFSSVINNIVADLSYA